MFLGNTKSSITFRQCNSATEYGTIYGNGYQDSNGNVVAGVSPVCLPTGSRFSFDIVTDSPLTVYVVIMKNPQGKFVPVAGRVGFGGSGKSQSCGRCPTGSNRMLLDFVQPFTGPKYADKFTIRYCASSSPIRSFNLPKSLYDAFIQHMMSKKQIISGSPKIVESLEFCVPSQFVVTTINRKQNFGVGLHSFDEVANPNSFPLISAYDTLTSGTSGVLRYCNK